MKINKEKCSPLLRIFLREHRCVMIDKRKIFDTYQFCMYPKTFPFEFCIKEYFIV